MRGVLFVVDGFLFAAEGIDPVGGSLRKFGMQFQVPAGTGLRHPLEKTAAMALFRR